MLQRLFKPRPAAQAGRALFKALSAQARHPIFYERLAVADTVEGRFELYVLHLVLVLHRLKGQGVQAAETSQSVFDTFLRNLDEGLRDMGVGDLSVGKKMRKLGEAVYGRIKSYDRAFADADQVGALQALIARTVYQDRPDATSAKLLAVYAAAVVGRLAAEPLDDVLQARLDWPEAPLD
ncbi:ubiquinol-cytochrome C chaperone family protein [Caulobacter sp. S45]|uniref:ubiquinol-cytochrome C chaperone family protein n=1 Tax=Caulobacter sp. S45 TaxID=1641861 RepID=UPI001576BAF9|nr:ubiquinol-cytochrome C chaperone family protein [Caulobacter sp. S45]